MNSRGCNCAAKSGPPGTEHDERCWSRTPEYMDPELYWRVLGLADGDCRAALMAMACDGPGFATGRAVLAHALDVVDQLNAEIAEYANRGPGR